MLTGIVGIACSLALLGSMLTVIIYPLYSNEANKVKVMLTKSKYIK